MTGQLKWCGTTRRGTHVIGWTVETPGALTERLYRQRYRDLEVTNPAGELVGAILPHPDTGRRVWWAES